MLAEFPNKIRLIEDMNFEFDFLSTILLVWRTETGRQADEARWAEEARRADVRMVEEATVEMADQSIEIIEDDPDDPPPAPMLALPAPRVGGRLRTEYLKAQCKKVAKILSPTRRTCLCTWAWTTARWRS